ARTEARTGQSTRPGKCRSTQWLRPSLSGTGVATGRKTSRGRSSPAALTESALSGGLDDVPDFHPQLSGCGGGMVSKYDTPQKVTLISAGNALDGFTCESGGCRHRLKIAKFQASDITTGDYMSLIISSRDENGRQRVQYLDSTRQYWPSSDGPVYRASSRWVMCFLAFFTLGPDARLMPARKLDRVSPFAEEDAALKGPVHLSFS
ncbi:hypothetical protein THAOC_01174, partial [Thalassiosira oceanica]